MSILEKAALNEKGLLVLVKVVRDVGFPIVVAGVLIYIGYQFGDRLLTSQTLFIEKVGTQVERQTELNSKVLDTQSKVLETQDKIIGTQDRQTNLIEKQIELIGKTQIQTEKNQKEIKNKADK